MSMKAKTTQITITVMSFPLHRLAWLRGQFPDKSQSELVSEALIHYAAYWQEKIDPDGSKEAD